MRIALSGLLSIAIGTAVASAASRDFTWEALQKAGLVSAGTVLPPDGDSPFHHLRVEGTDRQSTVTVLTIDRPRVAGPRYALTGQVRYEGMEGAGYLELWNIFPDGGRFFTRTLGDSGPMMKLHGTSGWRPFSLPFDATGAPHPTRLVVNVVFEGRGAVYLGPLQLIDVPGQSTDLHGGTGRTLDEQAGLLGGVAGVVAGGVGALIGVLTSLGRGRRFVVAAAISLVVFGTLTFAAGVVTLTRSHPYAVYYPLLLVGFLSAVVPLGVMPAIRRRYEEVELRTMRAHDVGL